MKIIEFEPEHILRITPQASQRYIVQGVDQGEILSSGTCFTGLLGETVVAIGGVLPVCPGRGYLHLIVAEGITHQWTQLYRAARALIKACEEDYLRIETLASTPQEERWLEMLGFEYEGLMRCIMPDGRDAKSYSIVRKQDGIRHGSTGGP